VLGKNHPGVRESFRVAGYCNDVFACIPSLRVLNEGGKAMICYTQSGPFMPTIEETIIEKVQDLVQRIHSESP
jgi:neutral ceramidase